MARKPEPLPPKPKKSAKLPGLITGRQPNKRKRLPIPAESPRAKQKRIVIPLYPGDMFTDPNYTIPATVILPSGKAKSGRKKTPPLDWLAIGVMCECGSLIMEIAGVLGISTDHLHKCYLRDNPGKGTFSDFRELHMKKGHQRLRKAMYQKALDQDDFQAQKWLSQHYLGMDAASQKIDINANAGGVKVTFCSVKLPRDTDTTPETT